MTDRILLADDDADFREEFKDSFEEYGVLEAGDGREALDILKKPNEIDLVILDLKMPGLNGIDVLKEIKKIDKDMSVIIFTGYGSKEVVIEALRSKVDDFIEKPIDIEKTKIIIDRVLDAKKIGEDIDAKGMEGKIEKVKYFIKRNANKKIGLKDAASSVYMSQKYLSRIFKQFTGVGFKDYLLEQKIAIAKQLLEKTRYSVEQISYRIGYENSESFIRAFQKITNLTPSAYRNKKMKRKKSKT